MKYYVIEKYPNICIIVHIFITISPDPQLYSWINTVLIISGRFNSIDRYYL